MGARRGPWKTLAALVVVVGLTATACSTTGNDSSSTTLVDPTTDAAPTTTPSGSGEPPLSEDLQISVLSSQPDRISGEQARIRVDPAPGQPLTEIRLSLGDVDVTDSLVVVDDHLEGVVDGLIEGNNTLTATSADQEAVARVRAWPITGPIISGPHMALLACSTEENGLGAPTDDDCSAPTEVTWQYISSEGTLKNLDDPNKPPPDVGRASIDGQEVPLLVRHEKGVINRSVYEIASIDPTPGNDQVDGPGWNGKLLYRFGGGCGTTYGQGTSLTSVTEPAYLRQGYAIATATFNTFAVQCNDVLSAETAMMVKERVIEEFGVPDFTIGEGGSGGAIQVHLLAQNYPGIIDGAVAVVPFPDALSIAPGVTDCGLLLAYYRSGAGASFSEAQRKAINGHASPKTCQTWASTFLIGIDPTKGCDPKIDPKLIYDPVANRGGLRCTLQDANINQFGTDPATGWAARPLDNTGVQYGLAAFNDGTIDFEQFATLNEKVGGYDIDGKITAHRAVAAPEALLQAYESGRISMGGGDQTTIPIIDIDIYTDPSGDIHDRFRAFSLRARLEHNGATDAPGFVIWTRDPGSVDLTEALAGAVAGGTGGTDAVAVVDQWLSAMAKDRGPRSPADKLERSRPAEAIDNCIPKGADRPVGATTIYEDAGPCRDDYPLAGDPRIAAGGPLSSEILKCMLKRLDPADYKATLDASQLERLALAFPLGVCDWNSPGVAATAPVSPDRSYQDVQTPGQSA